VPNAFQFYSARIMISFGNCLLTRLQLSTDGPHPTGRLRLGVYMRIISSIEISEGKSTLVG